VCVIVVHDTCAAIIKVSQSKYIKFPTGNDLQSVIDGFNMKWDMMQCAGAIDGCHIPVKPPSLNHTDFYNRKGWYSIILQALVDDVGNFTDICVGWSGKVYDACVLQNSQLYAKGERQSSHSWNCLSACSCILQKSLNIPSIALSALVFLDCLAAEFIRMLQSCTYLCILFF